MRGKALYNYREEYKTLTVEIDEEFADKYFELSQDLYNHDISEERIMPYKEHWVCPDRNRRALIVYVRNKTGSQDINFRRGEFVDILVNVNVYQFLDGKETLCYWV